MNYEPELGQAFFSNTPWTEHRTPPYITAGIDALATVVMTQAGDEMPLTTNFGGEDFDNGTFALRSYCWCDGEKEGHEDGCPPNFECGDFTAYWYKHSGRGETCSAPLTVFDWQPIFARCLNSLADRNQLDSKRPLA